MDALVAYGEHEDAAASQFNFDAWFTNDRAWRRPVRRPEFVIHQNSALWTLSVPKMCPASPSTDSVQSRSLRVPPSRGHAMKQASLIGDIGCRSECSVHLGERLEWKGSSL
jgi:hypothetical protein